MLFFRILDKGPFKYYVSKEVGGWALKRQKHAEVILEGNS